MNPFGSCRASEILHEMLSQVSKKRRRHIYKLIILYNRGIKQIDMCNDKACRGLLLKLWKDRFLKKADEALYYANRRNLPEPEYLIELVKCIIVTRHREAIRFTALWEYENSTLN